MTNFILSFPNDSSKTEQIFSDPIAAKAAWFDSYAEIIKDCHGVDIKNNKRHRGEGNETWYAGLAINALLKDVNIIPENIYRAVQDTLNDFDMNFAEIEPESEDPAHCVITKM